MPNDIIEGSKNKNTELYTNADFKSVLRQCYWSSLEKEQRNLSSLLHERPQKCQIVRYSLKVSKNLLFALNNRLFVSSSMMVCKLRILEFLDLSSLLYK